MAKKFSDKAESKSKNNTKQSENNFTEKSTWRKITDIITPIIIFVIIVCYGIHILNKHYQNQILVSQLKTAYSTIDQGFKNAIAVQDGESITTTPLWINCNIKILDKNIEKCEAELKKIFLIKEVLKDSDGTDGIITDRNKCLNSIGKYNKWWHLNSNSQCSGWNNLTFILNNGMKTDILIIGENDSYIVGQLTVDINGSKEPNRWGRDAFMFNIMRDGGIMPYGGYRDCKRLAEYLNMNLDSILTQRHWQYTDICSKTTTSDGTACAARVIENNWEMDY